MSITQIEAISGGLMPPAQVEFEKAVLGAVMLEKQAFGKLEGIITEDMFYQTAHSHIFSACQALSKRNRPIDILEVISELKAMKKLDASGGHYYVTTLTTNVVSGANVEYHAQRIVEAWKKRKIIDFSMKLLRLGYDLEISSEEAISFNEKELTSLSIANASRIQPIDSILIKTVGEVVSAMQSSSHIIGVPSGFKELDKKTHGWQKSDLVILAARPAVGKTAFALNLARNAAASGAPAAFFSLEMSASQLAKRMIASESGVFLEKIITGNLDDYWKNKMFNDGVRPLSGAPVYVDDTPGLNIYQLRSRAREAKRRHGIEIIFIDYLQLMSGMDRKSNREGEISEISRSLKALAKELDIPIIALSQLSRKIEERERKEPQLSDLRESGAIEQDADMVLFLSRPEYYGVRTNEMGESNEGLTEVKIAKARSGKLGTINLRADLSIQKFYDWEGKPPELHAAGRWTKIEHDRELNPF